MMTTCEPHPVVFWEITGLCDLHCRSCPSGAGETRDPNELSTYESYKTIDQIAALQPRELVITGGDALAREDLHQVIDYARRRGLDPALVLVPTPELTAEALCALQAKGLTRVVFSVDGSTPATHESLRGVPETFASTVRALWWAKKAGLRLEVNTLVTRRNLGDLEAIAALLGPFGIDRWNVHFLVPAGASRSLEMITAAEVELVFARLARIRDAGTFAVRVVEAPHYRRFLLERLLQERMSSVSAEWQDFSGYQDEMPDDAALVRDAALGGARNFLFISHAGDVRLSEFAPQSAGNLRYRSLGDIYRGSDLLVALRDPDNYHGKCFHCDFRVLCGGSRARAFAMTGDLLGTDPLCAYEPRPGTAIAAIQRAVDSGT
ncbi:MAG: radical SAM protein [Acidobacteriota bacterium]